MGPIAVISTAGILSDSDIPASHARWCVRNRIYQV
jgi:hypothetical protein